MSTTSRLMHSDLAGWTPSVRLLACRDLRPVQSRAESKKRGAYPLESRFRGAESSREEGGAPLSWDGGGGADGGLVSALVTFAFPAAAVKACPREVANSPSTRRMYTWYASELQRPARLIDSAGTPAAARSVAAPALNEWDERPLAGTPAAAAHSLSA